MIKFIFSIAFVAFVAFVSMNTQTAFAGPKVNNGGGGWVCTDKKAGSVRWIKTIDLVQTVDDATVAKKFEKMSLPDLKKSIETRLLETSPETSALLKQFSLDLKKIEFVDFALQDTQDFNLVNKPSNSTCEGGKLSYIQLANTLYDGRVLINREAWEQLPSLQRAALIFHERLYFAFRAHFDDQYSDRTRDFVSALFSDLKDSVLKDLFVERLRAKYDDIPDSEPIATFAVNVACEATNSTNAEKPEFSEVWTEKSDNSERTIGFSDKTFRFQVELSGLDGVPTRLIIYDTSSNAQFVLDDAKPVFMMKKSVAITSYLTVEKVDYKLQLRCWNQ